MIFEYFKKFNLTKELENSLSAIISQNENGNFVCRRINVTVYENNTTNKIHISKRNYSLFVIMDNEAFQIFSSLSFTDKDDLKRKLKDLSLFYMWYNGVFNSDIICHNFPYLKSFFNDLDKWRAYNDRVTIDKDILDECTNKALNNQTRKRKR